MLTRVRANAPVNLRDRMEKAIAERIVGEDGVAAVSEVIGGRSPPAGAGPVLRPRVTIVLRRWDDDDDARR